MCIEPSQLRDGRRARGPMSPTDPKAPLLGADPNPPAGAADLEALDRAMRLYLELGFSAERAAITLARNGYPSEAVVARFPDVSARLICSNTKSRVCAVGGKAGQGAGPPMAGALLDRLLTRSTHSSGPADSQRATQRDLQPRRAEAKQTERQPNPAPVRTVVDAHDSSAISFQYVPLI